MLFGAGDRRGTQTARRRAVPVAASIATLALLSGCVPPADEPGASLAGVVLERDRASAALHTANVERAAVFLRDKWGPVSLPEEPIVRWVPGPDWGGVMVQCLEQEGFPGALPADGGERVDYSGVRLEGPRELFEADVASYVCQARYPVYSWYAAQVSDIESPWAWEYATDVLVPCLLAAGYRPPALPAESEFRESWRTDAAWDPYALLAADPGQERRARSQCPPPEALLEGAP